VLCSCYYHNPYGARRRYRPPSLASLAIAALFWRCISAACSLIFVTACVSGNPISQYPGGVDARSHCARCLDTAWRCALTPAVRASTPPSLLVEVEAESHSDGTSVGDDGGGGESLHRGASSLGGNGPTAAYHYGRPVLVRRELGPQRRRTYVATFLALTGVQRVSVPSPTHDFVERERHARVRHGVDLELRVDRRRRTAARASVSRNWRRRWHHRHCYVAPGAFRRRWRVRCWGVLGRRWARALVDTFALRRRGGVPEGKRCEASVGLWGWHEWKACLESPPAFVTLLPWSPRCRSRRAHV
jgi:hypothetical protein